MDKLPWNLSVNFLRRITWINWSTVFIVHEKNCVIVLFTSKRFLLFYFLSYHKLGVSSMQYGEYQHKIWITPYRLHYIKIQYFAIAQILISDCSLNKNYVLSFSFQNISTWESIENENTNIQIFWLTLKYPCFWSWNSHDSFTMISSTYR